MKTIVPPCTTNGPLEEDENNHAGKRMPIEKIIDQPEDVGTSPKSWIQAAEKKRQLVSELTSQKRSEVVKMDTIVVNQTSVVKTKRADSTVHGSEDVLNKETENGDLKKLLAVREDEIRRLAAALADELLKAYEASVAKKRSYDCGA